MAASSKNLQTTQTDKKGDIIQSHFLKLQQNYNTKESLPRI